LEEKQEVLVEKEQQQRMEERRRVLHNNDYKHSTTAEQDRIYLEVNWRVEEDYAMV
jgi:hypothetical protein